MKESIDSGMELEGAFIGNEWEITRVEEEKKKKNTFLGSGIFLSGFDGTTLIFVSVFGLIFLNRLSLFFFFWDPFSLTV